MENRRHSVFDSVSRKRYLARIAQISAVSLVSEAMQLALCTLISHSLTSNPITGGMMYLLFISSRVALSIFVYARASRAIRILMPLFALLFAAALFLLCTGAAGSLLIAAGIVMLRTGVSELYHLSLPGRGALKTFVGAFLHAVFALLFTLLFAGYVSGAVLFAAALLFAASGALMLVSRSSPFFAVNVAPASTPGGVFSYNVYMNMVLFSHIAVNIGMIIFAAYLGFSYSAMGYVLYLALAAFFLLIMLLYFLSARVIRSRGKMLRLGLFISGALIWCFAYCMFVGETAIGALTVLWAGLWAFGQAAMRSVIDRFSDDFELLSALTEQPFSVKALKQNNILLQAVAFITATLIALVMLGMERIILPDTPQFTISPTFRFFMTFIPVALMLVSVGFAMRQPLDLKNRQRLQSFLESGGHTSRRLQERLKRLLVYKYRVRYGVKIIMALLRPIFRIKVYGAENIDRGSFPSVFVCNHGFIYGPIAAVIYLPVYFRPWIDDRMVEKELIISQIMRAFARIPLADGVKRAISSALAVPVRWALTSFDPITVTRSNLRNVMKTMHDTVDAMLDNDNVLIFPENPELTENQYTHGRLGEFFTGFTQIGKLYHDATGESALFYPVYANKRARTLRIGKPLKFSPKIHAKAERERISGELHAAMSALAEMD